MVIPQYFRRLPKSCLNSFSLVIMFRNNIKYEKVPRIYKEAQIVKYGHHMGKTEGFSNKIIGTWRTVIREFYVSFIKC